MKRLLLIILLLGGCAPTTGVATPSPTPSPTPTRQYTLYKPPSFDKAKTYPLILVYHGSGQTRDDMVKLTKLNALADKENVLIAYLAYSNGGWDMARDKDFTLKVIDELKANVDPQRIYATGFSMGAVFVNDLAIELPDRLRAVAAVGGGSRDIKTVRSGRPVPLLTIQGDLDRNRQSFTVSNAEWDTWAGCGSPKKSELVPGKVSQTVSTCADSSRHEVVWLTGVSHEWPNGPDNGYAIDAATYMWQFFTATSRR
jgi:poly(3-hydroxybutyrate) depolymerase